MKKCPPDGEHDRDHLLVFCLGNTYLLHDTVMEAASFPIERYK